MACGLADSRRLGPYTPPGDQEMQVFRRESRFRWLCSKPFGSMSGAPRPLGRGQKSGGFAPRPSRELVVCTYERFFRFLTLSNLTICSVSGSRFLIPKFLIRLLGYNHQAAWKSKSRLSFYCNQSFGVVYWGRSRSLNLFDPLRPPAPKFNALRYRRRYC